MADEQLTSDPIELATELTIAWLSNPNTRAQANEVPEFLRTMHQAVAQLAAPQVDTGETNSSPSHEPAVTVRKSLASPEHIISLIDGKAYKTLKRHLANNGLTPAQYRERYGLKPDYPMVAPAYGERRRALAKSMGLGRKPKVASEDQLAKPSRARRGKAAS